MSVLSRLALLAALSTLTVACNTSPEDTGGKSDPDPSTVDADSDGSTADIDCDDADAAVYPGAPELCNDRDDDCDGAADEDAADAATGYPDADGDGHGDPDGALTTCDLPSTYVAAGDDCDDTNASINPGATEVCDALDVDEDCSGAADDADPNVDLSDATVWYADADADGYGDAGDALAACDALAGRVENADDCDDTAYGVNPGAQEVCDAADVDEDCSGVADDLDGAADPSTMTTFFADGDGDGYGDAAMTMDACDMPFGYVVDATDCDDARSDVSPGAREVCDDADVDEDCDGGADNDDPGAFGETTWYADADGDGYGDTASTIDRCDLPEGYVADWSDCDDTEGAVYPGAVEMCDGIANDCDTLADWTEDAEDGTASFMIGGAWYDLTADLGSGTMDSPLIASVVADGEIHVCEGTWYVNLDASGYDVSILGRQGSDATVLDGGGAGRVLASTGGTLTMEGLTIQNGSSTTGGGVYCLATDLEMNDVVVWNNTASSNGGGLYLQTCDDAALTDVYIYANTARSGGGLYATTSDGVVLTSTYFDANAASATGGGAVLSYSDFTATDVVFYGNSAGSGYSGGGLAVASLTGTVANAWFMNNYAGAGGALYLSSADLTLTDSDVSANATYYGGGAAYVYYGSALTATDATFSENLAGDAGTIAIEASSSASFTSSTFWSNYGADAGVFSFANIASATIAMCDFADNTPNDALAGGTGYWFGTGASATCDTSGCM